VIILTAIFAVMTLRASVSAQAYQGGLPTDIKFPIGNFHTVLVEGQPALESYNCPQNKCPRALVLRGSQPDHNGIDALVAAGVKTVVNLEGGSEDEQERTLIGGRMQYYSFPMGGDSPPTVEELKQALPVTTNSLNYPIYIHCQRGRDRTGFQVAALRMSEGWDANRAIKEWKNYRDFWSKFSRLNEGEKLLQDGTVLQVLGPQATETEKGG
jgi:protein-tyrosine phosphatase